MTRSSRGRPRRPDIDKAIFAATVALIRESGLEAANIGAVAHRADVSRPTVYRRFKDKRALLEACITDIINQQLQAPRQVADPLQQIVELLANTVQMLTTTPIGDMYRAALPHINKDPELADLIGTFGATRRKALNQALNAAQTNGLLASGDDIEVVGDALVGAIYMRFLMTGRKLDRAYVETLCRAVLGDGASMI
mgnify:FL=1